MEREFPYSVVEQISYLRCAGTQEEKQAAKWIQNEIEKMGGQSEWRPFPIQEAKISHSRIFAGDPLNEEIEAIPYGRCGSFPEGGCDLNLFYAERGVEEDYTGVDDLSDSIVLVHTLKPEVYELLCKKHAAAFLVIVGKHYDTMESASVYKRNLRPYQLEQGIVPGFLIRAADAMKLVKNHVQKLHVELQQDELELESQNILATIPGTVCAEESIVLTAHYDSVSVGTGAWDNATGTAVLLYIYRYFLAHPPKRTLRFIWCGSEEIGLCGSKAYVEQEKEGALKEIRFCFNFDMCGTILGPNEIYVTGKEDLKTFVTQFCKETGYSAEIKAIVHSSDSAPFADHGVPSVGISRGGSGAEIHTIHDVIDTVSQEQLLMNGEFAISMIERIANAVRLPVEFGMDEEMKEKLDRYFQRKAKKE